MNNEKNQNNSVILRFVYDQYSDGIQSNEGIQDGNLRRVEPSIDMIKKHISQMKDIFTKYSTTIYTIQMGFLEHMVSCIQLVCVQQKISMLQLIVC